MAKPHAKQVAALHKKAHASVKAQRNVTHKAGVVRKPVFDSSEWNALPDAKA